MNDLTFWFALAAGTQLGVLCVTPGLLLGLYFSDHLDRPALRSLRVLRVMTAALMLPMLPALVVAVVMTVSVAFITSFLIDPREEADNE